MQSNKIEILGKAISQGKGLQINLDIAKLHTRTKIEVPIIIERGKEPGPTILITGGIHGMFRTSAILGKLYNKGDKIGSISDPFGYFEKDVKAPNKGYVFCLNHAPIVNKGDTLFHLSIEE